MKKGNLVFSAVKWGTKGEPKGSGREWEIRLKVKGERGIQE
jgi:hypothetical protein